MIEQALVQRVKGDAVIAPLISGKSGLRFYRAAKVPQFNAHSGAGSRPMAVYRRISTPRWQSLRMRGGGPHPRIQVDCYGDVAGDARTLAEAFRRLDGEGNLYWPTGLTAQGQPTQLWVFKVELADDGDAELPPISGLELAADRVALDLVIWYMEPAPPGLTG